MKRDRASVMAVALLAATLAAGCAAGPDFRRPELPQAERYTAQPPQFQAGADEAAQQVQLGAQLGAAWWRLFQSDALEDVVKRALARNQGIVAARHALAQAEAHVAAQSGTLAPQLDLIAGAGREKRGAASLGTAPKMPAYSQYAIGPTVHYAFDYRGGGERAVEWQEARASHQRQQLNAACLAVTGNAVVQSLRIAALRAQIAIVERVLELDRENLHVAQLAFEAGAQPRQAVVAAEGLLAADAALLPPLRQEVSVAEHALALLLGQGPADAALPVFDLDRIALPGELPVSLPSELAHRRPDILAAEAELRAATAAVGIATANLYPRIDLRASLGQQAISAAHLFERGNTAWSFAGVLVAPLFDGGSLRAERRAAEAAMQASIAMYQQTVLAAFGQVADSLRGLEHGAEALAAQGKAGKAARDQFELTRKSRREGQIGRQPVIAAERNFELASLAQVRARGQRYLDTAQLFLALGGVAPEAEVSAMPAAVTD